MTQEMIKLRELLDEKKIKWWDCSFSGGDTPFVRIDRTHFKYRGFEWSVVHGFGSYGGWSYNRENEGLLELMSEAVNDGEPVGWLTAEQVIEYVLGH